MIYTALLLNSGCKPRQWGRLDQVGIQIIIIAGFTGKCVYLAGFLYE